MNQGEKEHLWPTNDKRKKKYKCLEATIEIQGECKGTKKKLSY